MAKMFYTLEEAAERLGKSEDEVKAMAESGELQQFRDRDQVMFKVDQIDSMSGGGGAEDSGEIVLEDVSSQTDTIDLVAETEDSYGLSSDTAKSATATGIRPLCTYARRSEKPLVDYIEDSTDSWQMLGTNLSIKNATRAM